MYTNTRTNPTMRAAFVCTFLALLAVASAQPCIECSACGNSNNCLANCKRDCPKVVAKTADIDKCRQAGREAGQRVAKASCDLTLTFCKGGQQQKNAFAGPRLVTLQQCGNIAFGECQNVAKDPKLSPCGASFNGVNQCDKTAFGNFYNGEVDERCNAEADRIEKSGPAGQTEKTGPAGQMEKTWPAGQMEKNGHAGQVEKTGPAGQTEKNWPAGQVENNGPAGQMENNGPAGQVENKGPAGQVEKSGRAGQMKNNGPAGQMEKTGPAGQVEKNWP